jgi:hypothetical protein
MKTRQSTQVPVTRPRIYCHLKTDLERNNAMVVLPAPFGPSNAKDSPFRIVYETLSTAAKAPNFFVTESSMIISLVQKLHDPL